jgi:glycolate oxidase
VYSLNNPLVIPILRDLFTLVTELGGTISGEHGIGADKRCFMDWMFNANDLETMQLVRRAFDPEHRANPGKLFPTPLGCAESSRRANQLNLPAEVGVI